MANGYADFAFLLLSHKQDAMRKMTAI